MEKRSIIGLGILLMVMVLIGGIAYTILTDDGLEKKEEKEVVLKYDTLNLEYEYIGDSVWEYKVTGTLPNPCYIIKTESLVMESYPENVKVISTVTPPDTETICIEVIQEIYQEGEFIASSEAEVSFEVK